MRVIRWHLSIFGALGLLTVAAQPVIASGRIIEADGRVLVRRSSNAPYELAAIGTVLQRGNWIRPDRGVHVRVRCADGTNRPVTAGVPSGLGVVCPNSTRRLRTRGRGEDDFLAFLNGTFIFATQVQDIDTLLQWHPFPDTSNYTLRIDDCDSEGFCDQREIWQQTVEHPSPQYDGEVLQREHTYLLTITTEDERGQLQTVSLRFRLISQGEVARIQTEIADIESQDLTAEAIAIVHSDIYESVARINTRTPNDVGLVFEAIAALEHAVSQRSQTPYLYRLLGDSYLQVGLLKQAKTAYEEAVGYAQSPEYSSDRVAAQIGLASIAAARGHLNEAEAWLQQAKIGYALLGEIRRVEDVQKWLDNLYNELSGHQEISTSSWAIALL